MANGDFKDLSRRTVSDKVLCGMAFEIAVDQRMTLLSCLHIFGKKARDTNTKTGTGTYESQELTNKLHKSITRNLEGCKVYSSYRANISEIQFLSKYNNRFRFVLHVIDI